MPVPHRIASLSRKGCPLREPWGITRRFHRLSPGRGLVAYALRTRAPLSCPEGHLPFDLHVLGLPLAFILSQDQTLHCIIVLLDFSFLFYRARCVFFRLVFLTGAARLPAAAPLTFLMLASSFQRTPANSLRFSPPFLPFAGAKVLHFHLPPTTIFTFFQCIPLCADCQKDNFHIF